MKLMWLPLCLVVSILVTSFMITQGYESGTIFLTNVGVGAILGYITGKVGYEA